MDPGSMRQKNLVVDKLRANDFEYQNATINQIVTQPGTYAVYSEAPNSLSRFTSIQAAVNQALVDGYGTTLAKKATILIYPKSDGSPYTGDGPNNEIGITSLISLIGQPSGSAVTSQVLIDALIRVTNSQPQQASFLNTATISNLFFQWTADRSAIILEGTDPGNNLAVLKVDNNIFVPISATLTNPPVQCIGPSQDLQSTGCFWFYGLNQDQFCVDLVDGGLMVMRESIVTARKFVRIRGAVTTPLSKFQMLRCEQNIEYPLLGGDGEFCTLYVANNFPSVECYFNYVLGITGTGASTNPNRYIYVDGAVTTATIVTQLNTVSLRPNASATQYVYDIPNVVGVTVSKYDIAPSTAITAKTVGNYINGTVV